MKNRNILYIGPKFFNYEVEIQKTIVELGSLVTFYDERPNNTLLVRVLIRLRLSFLIKPLVAKHYRRILKEIAEKTFDYVLIISPETITTNIMKALKASQKDAYFILYMWDSFSNKNSKDIVGCFDKVLSFDEQDAKQLGLFFLPLFYIREYENIKSLPVDYCNDLLITATAHSDRYAIYNRLKNQLDVMGLKHYSYFYLPSKIMYWVRKVFIKKYSYGNIKNFSFVPLSQSSIIDEIEKSKVILDINHPGQIGLTSRCLEALGAKRKLITTNESIRYYDFYNENNILIIDRIKPLLDERFFLTDYVDIPKHIYEKYSLRNWVLSVFG